MKFVLEFEALQPAHVQYRNFVAQKIEIWKVISIQYTCQKRKNSSQCYWYILLTAVGLRAGGSSRVHIWTQTVHITTQWGRIHRTEQILQKEYINIRIQRHNTQN